MSYMDTSYQKIILNAINGSKEAIAQIIKKEQNNVRLALYYLKKDNSDTADLVQEILFKISKKITHLKSPLLFKSWLNQIIVNSFYDYLRKKKKHIETIDIDNNPIIEIKDSEKNNPQNLLITREIDNVIKNAISNLPERYKIPITLRELSGLSYVEISKITNTTVGTIKSRISRARAMIKEEVKKYDNTIK